jgi:hypothetical protein|tara:strand:- start:156 stop:392 length:237 start_codon:yes stop_codon:yes gene_type:complete
MERFIGIKKLCGFVFIICGICWILQTIAVIIGVIIGDYWFIDDRVGYLLNLFGLVISGILIKLLGGSLSKINGNGYKP